MSADSPAVSSTVQHGGFTFSGTGAEDAVKIIQADEKAKAKKAAPESGTDEPETGTEKPKGKAALSEAASKLGKQGGKAAAEARAAKQAETDKAKPANTETEEAEAEPEKKAAASETEEEDDAAELDKHPRAKARVEEATRKAKEHREELQREREHRIRLEARLEALERSQRPAERESDKPGRAEFREDVSDEPQLDTYLAKHPGAEAKAISEWVSDRDRWRDAQHEERSKAKQHVDGLIAKHGAVVKAVGEVSKSDPEFWSSVEDIASELMPTEGVNVKTGQYFRVESPGPLNWLADELHDMPETAPKVMKYLAENRDDYETIKGYRSDRAVTRAVALIVAHVGRATAGEPHPTERPVSKPAQSMAPPPVRPVTGAPSTASGADPMPREGESFDAWNRRTGGKRTR